MPRAHVKTFTEFFHLSLSATTRTSFQLPQPASLFFSHCSPPTTFCCYSLRLLRSGCLVKTTFQSMSVLSQGKTNHFHSSLTELHQLAASFLPFRATSLFWHCLAIGCAESSEDNCCETHWSPYRLPYSSPTFHTYKPVDTSVIGFT